MGQLQRQAAALEQARKAALTETKKFPPTNETMMVIPPTYREWKISLQLQQQHHVTPTPATLHHTSIPPPSLLIGNSQSLGGDIIAITFRLEGDDEEEVTVIVEDVLSLDSLMETVMIEGSVLEDLDMAMIAILLIDTVKGKNRLLY